MTSRPVAIDIFAGGGGLSLGLEQAGFDIILAIDRDPYHAATFQRNFPLSRVLCADVRRLEGRKIRELIGDIDIDLICGGPPCQGFSHIGKRNSSDPRNLLIKHFSRLVAELRPKAFLMENVPALQEAKRKSPLSEAIDSLSAAGYRITTPARALDASNFGVPQRRGRLFVIGIRAEFNSVARYPRSSCNHRPPQPTVWDAICDLPRVSEHRELFEKDTCKYLPTGRSGLHPYAALARGVTIDPCDLAHPRVWDQTMCTGCSRVRHRREVIRLYAATTPGAFVPAHHLPRLNPNGLSPTLRAGTDSEHGSFNAPRPIHPCEPRCITVREAARLHGYPDWFRFHPTKWHAHQQIGNSVCPPVARALGFSIRRALRLRASKPSEALPLSDSFAILRRRGRRVRRIAQLDEWPKVLTHLLKKADPSTSGGLRIPTFSVRDVAEAFRATRARMPRTRPGQFLRDITRSRNRDQLLACIHRRGFSIKEIRRRGVYGQFVPMGTPGAIGSPSSILVAHHEIVRAKRILSSTCTCESLPKVLSFLNRPSVRKALLGNATLVGNGSDPSRISNREVLHCSVRHAVRTDSAVITVAGHRNLPDLSTVHALLAKADARTCILVCPVTNRHVAVIVLSRRAERVSVRARSVFEVHEV